MIVLGRLGVMVLVRLCLLRRLLGRCRWCWGRRIVLVNLVIRFRIFVLVRGLRLFVIVLRWCVGLILLRVGLVLWLWLLWMLLWMLSRMMLRVVMFVLRLSRMSWVGMLLS